MTRYSNADGLCRSCGAEIWWAWKDGKRIIVDRHPHPEGTLLLRRNDQTGVVTAVAMAKGSDPRLRQSHFKTCPDASKWTKKKTNPKKKPEVPDGGSSDQA